MLKKEMIFALTVFVALASFGAVNATEFSLPGIIESTGTHFEINDSDYINISIISDDEINLYLESTPKIIILSIESSGNDTSTTLDLSGLDANKTYYMYENSHMDETIFTTDNLGNYAYTQDISQLNHIWIQEGESTTFISEDTTLTSDISGTVEINTSNVVLNCDGHSIVGTDPSGLGVYLLFGTNNITVKNCKISNFSQGVFFINSENNTFENNTFENNNLGIDLRDGTNNLIINNTLSGGIRGIRIYSSSMIERYNSILDNTMFNSVIGLDLLRALNNTITGNTIYSNIDGGIRIVISSNNTIYDNYLNNTINTYNFGPTEPTNINFWNKAKTSGTNILNGPYLGGNFWAYPDGTGFSGNCTDSNNDGICDNSYAIDSNNLDYLPLTFLETNSPPTANSGGPYTVNEGSSVTLTASGSDPDNDSIIFEWDLDNDDIFETSGQIAEFSTLNIDGPSNQTVQVKVTDSHGAYATSQTTVEITNVAPTLSAINASLDPSEVNTTINATVDFEDQGILDTHSATWNWGDDTTSSGVVSETNGSGSVAGNHTYTNAGVYTVTLTVTDDDGDSGESTFKYVVIYDPEAGFVTGGGWINSPAGAYTLNSSLIGKANFGFVSRYKNGASVPTGQTKFVFSIADMNFQSTEYQWLVVAGANAKFKGDGEINNQEGYGFMLTAMDGAINEDEDKFRIKIWNKSSEEVIYDNQLGDSDDANANQTLGGGSIIIHS